jgi:hypothetical protein
MSDKIEILSPEFYNQFNGMTTKRVRINDSIVVDLRHCTLNGHAAEIRESTEQDPFGVVTDDIYYVEHFYDGAMLPEAPAIVKGYKNSFTTFSFPEDAFFALPEVIQDWFTRTFK